MMDDLYTQAIQLQEEMVLWRRHLHENPEVGMDVSATAAFVTARLKEMGYAPASIAGTGVTALVGGNKPGKCFLLRADMDALPISEETSLDFKSTNGYMHACGHDFHTAMLLGAAKLLKAHEDALEGTVKLMFQPAEENLKGAKALVDAGILENPKVDAAAMFHVAVGLPMPTGTIVVPDAGPLNAASDWFEINIRGKGGHGAVPEKTVDPLNVAAHTHIALQTIHSRELSAKDTAVLTIGMMAGGSTNNVIPDTAVLKGTIRTYDETVRQFLIKRIREISENTAKTFRAEAMVDILIGCPAVVCDGNIARDVRSSLQEVFGSDVPDPAALGDLTSNASEDFAFVAQRVPAVMMSISAGSPEEGFENPIHHPKVTFNEAVLSKGAAAYAIAAMGWLHRNNSETAGR